MRRRPFKSTRPLCRVIRWFELFALGYLVIDDLHAGWLSWQCQPGTLRAASYYVACLLISTPLFYVVFSVGDHVDGWLQGRLVSISLVTALALNFHHDLVDGLIWKRPAILR